MPTVVYCRCDERTLAHARGELTYSHDEKCWFFPEDPMRTMTTAAYFRAMIDRGKEFPHENHSGEHYRIVDCPWCGNVLPGTEDFLLGLEDAG